MQHPIDALDADALRENIPAQRAASLRILSTAMPPPAAEEPYAGQECVGLQEPWGALHALVSGVVTEKESNSCLVMGQSGCGKSLVRAACWQLTQLVDSVLRRIRQSTRAERRASPMVVRLSALMQPTDRQCLSEMAKQLIDLGAIGRADDVLRHVLEQDAEPDAEDERPEYTAPQHEVDSSDSEEEPLVTDQRPQDLVADGAASAILSTMASTLAHILSLLSSDEASVGRSLVVVLDQFDQFAKRPRQALLYCLLDAVQAGSYAPGLLIVGMTSRVDAPDYLEKRVKSRFSHRIIHVQPPSLDQYVILARSSLLGGGETPGSLGSAWRDEVEALVQEPTFRNFLQGMYDMSGDVRLLYQVLTVPVAALTPEAPQLHAQAFLDAAKTQQADGVQAMLLGA